MANTTLFNIGGPPKKIQATKLPGYGNVPGQKQSTASRPLNAWGPAPIPNFTPQTPAAALYAAPQAGAKPEISSGTAAGGVAHGDPRDPTYWTDVAKVNNTFNTNVSDYDRQDTAGLTARDNALAALDKQQPIDTSNARGQYNDAGLFYSSKLTSAETGITSAYDTNRTAARTGYSDLLSHLNILRNQNQNENGRDAQGNLTGTNYLDALNAATGRQITADQAAASANVLAGLNPDGSPKDQGGSTAPPPGGMVNGQFQSQILSPGVTSLINQWIAGSKKPTAYGSKPQKTTGR